MNYINLISLKMIMIMQINITIKHKKFLSLILYMFFKIIINYITKYNN